MIYYRRDLLHVNIVIEDWKVFQMKFSKYKMIDEDFLVIGSTPACFTVIKPSISEVVHEAL